MSIQYRTVLYTISNNKIKQVILSDMDRIIKQEDINRGYVLHSELLYYSKKMLDAGVLVSDLNKSTRIIESTQNTSLIKTITLSIR